MLGMISLAIAILTVVPKHQSGKFVYRWYRCRWYRMDATSESCPLLSSNLAQYTVTGQRACVTQSSSVFSLVFRIGCKKRASD